MRWELKYLVPNKYLDALRSEIAPYTYLDKHGLGYEETGYTVRSIYLDSRSLTFYFEKKAGIKIRRKLRVRGYNVNRPTDWIFLEIKRKQEQAVSKNRAPLLFKDLEALFSDGRVADYIRSDDYFPNALDDARRFFFHVFRYDLRPTDMTVYEREAFMGCFDPTLRITFDRNLRGRYYPLLGELYCNDGLRSVLPGYFIMEVKYNTQYPGWLKPLIGKYHLQNQSISKYSLCLEVYHKEKDPVTTVLANTRTVYI